MLSEFFPGKFLVQQIGSLSRTARLDEDLESSTETPWERERLFLRLVYTPCAPAMTGIDILCTLADCASKRGVFIVIAAATDNASCLVV